MQPTLEQGTSTSELKKTRTKSRARRSRSRTPRPSRQSHSSNNTGEDTFKAPLTKEELTKNIVNRIRQSLELDERYNESFVVSQQKIKKVRADIGEVLSKTKKRFQEELKPLHHAVQELRERMSAINTEMAQKVPPSYRKSFLNSYSEPYTSKPMELEQPESSALSPIARMYIILARGDFRGSEKSNNDETDEKYGTKIWKNKPLTNVLAERLSEYSNRLPDDSGILSTPAYPESGVEGDLEVLHEPDEGVGTKENSVWSEEQMPSLPSSLQSKVPLLPMKSSQGEPNESTPIKDNVNEDSSTFVQLKATYVSSVVSSSFSEPVESLQKPFHSRTQKSIEEHDMTQMEYHILTAPDLEESSESSKTLRYVPNDFIDSDSGRTNFTSQIAMDNEDKLQHPNVKENNVTITEIKQRIKDDFTNQGNSLSSVENVIMKEKCI